MKQVVFLILFIAITVPSWSQSFTLSPGTGTQIQFVTENQINEGIASLGLIQLGFDFSNPILITNWKLTVQLSSPITMNGTALDPPYVRLQHNPALASDVGFGQRIQAPTSYIPLSFNEITLIESASAPIQSPPNYYFTLRYNLRIEGGPHLLELRNGIYSIPLLFRIYDEAGVLRLSASGTYQFEKRFQDSGSGDVNPIRTISLANGTDNVDLNFESEEDYRTGVSKLLLNSLKVQGQSAYQIRVKAMTNLSGLSDIIPISIVGLQASPGNYASGTSYQTIRLSTEPQTLLTKTGETDPNPVYYNLRYFINSDDSMSLQSKTGSYSTHLIFNIESN